MIPIFGLPIRHLHHLLLKPKLQLQPKLSHQQACGATPVNGLLLAARQHQLKPQLLGHCNSGDTAGDKGRVVGVRAQDAEQGLSFDLRAACVINATGVWVDDMRALDAHSNSGQDSSTPNNKASKIEALVQASQGIHLVVDRSFWPHDHALIVPKTSDGRVLFVIPW